MRTQGGFLAACGLVLLATSAAVLGTQPTVGSLLRGAVAGLLYDGAGRPASLPVAVPQRRALGAPLAAETTGTLDDHREAARPPAC